jgi:hypothetical protein
VALGGSTPMIVTMRSSFVVDENREGTPDSNRVQESYSKESQPARPAAGT